MVSIACGAKTYCLFITLDDGVKIVAIAGAGVEAWMTLDENGGILIS